MSSTSIFVSVFEIILILAIISIQIYVAYTTFKRIEILKNFLSDENNLSLNTYYFNQDELQTVKAEDVTGSSKYTVANRIDNIDEPIYKRGSLTRDGKTYFSTIDAYEDDALFILTPTDYTTAAFEPILTSDVKKKQIASMRDNSCSYNMRFGKESDVMLIKKGTVQLQDDGKWLVTEKCKLRVTRKPEGVSITSDEDD